MKNKVLVFDTKPYDIDSLKKAAEGKNIEFDFLDVKLTSKTASLAKDCEVICLFVHDQACEETLEQLSKQGIKLIALRSAGYNNVVLKKAAEVGIKVVRVPEYSPYAVAEHAAALVMVLNRKIHRAYARVKENNFSLNGLLGFDMYGKTVGIVGTGRIGQIMISIMKGFGCKVVAYDLYKNEKAAQELGFEYIELNDLLKQSDIISLHLPLTKETHHLINKETIAQMKNNVVLVNTSRGQLIETTALIEGLKSGKIKAAGLDVYEEEEQYFFEDLSGEIIQDDVLARLLSFNNVIVTSHQAFFTQEAVHNIAKTTISNICEYLDKKPLTNEIKS